MNMFKNEGEFKPDSLIASADFPILKEAIGLKKGQGVLKRGTLISKDGGAGVIASADKTDVFGILTDEIDTGIAEESGNVASVCYITGIFNKDAVIVAEGATISTFADAMRNKSQFLRGAQEY
jgi:hypothetical protein